MPREQAKAGPSTRSEQSIAAIWSDILGQEVDDIDASFFSLGGDSLQALSACLEMERKFHRKFPVAAITAHPTIRGFAEAMEADAHHTVTPGAAIVLREGNVSGAGPQGASSDAAASRILFVLPGTGGNVFNYHALVAHLPSDWRVIGLPLPGADALEPPVDSIHTIAARFLKEARRHQPTGPLVLAGYSFGGRVAFEMAAQLLAAGEKVKLLAMFDTRGPNWPPPLPFRRRLGLHVRNALSSVSHIWPGHADHEQSGISVPAGESSLDDEATRAKADALGAELLAACEVASKAWVPRRLPVEICLFRAAVSVWVNTDTSDPTMGWGPYAEHGVRCIEVPGVHGTLFQEPNVSVCAARLTAMLAPDKADG